MTDKNRGIRLRIVGLLLVVFLLSGCVPVPAPTQPDTTPSTTAATEPPTAEPTETTATEPPTTEPPEPLPDMEPVTMLTCTRWRTFPQTLSLGDGIVLASRNFYSPEENAIINSMELIDVYGDTVLQTATNGSTREVVKQRFDDGCFLVADPESRCFYVYDQQLQILDSFSAPNVDGYFSYDRKNYYYVENDILYRMDVASGNQGRMALEWDIRLERLLAVHPEETLLVARFYLSPYTTDCGIAVINAANGKIKLLSNDYSYVWLAGDGFYGMRMNDELYGYDVYYGDLNGGQINRVSTDQLNLGRMSYTMLHGSDYLLCKAAADDDSGTAVRHMITGQFCDLSSYGFDRSALGCIYLPDEQLIFGFYENGYDFDPILLAPYAMMLEGSVTPEAVRDAEQVEVSLAEDYLAQEKGPELPASFGDVRKLADELEKKYDVTVLLGEQVTDTCVYADYKVQTEENASAIRTALGLLDQELARYPKGFWEQFRNGAGEGGIWLCLTGKIDGVLSPTGFAAKNRDRYNVVLDITDAGLQSTVHHELWHAIEMKLSTDTFNTTRWADCNPAGFAYYGSYDGGYSDLTRWTYAGGSGADSYFADAYSRINGREDRARIWENIMSTDDPVLLEAIAIQKKLEIMVEAIRQGFNTDGWTDVHWE